MELKGVQIRGISPDGQAFSLEAPLELTLRADRQVPCDGLTASFPLQEEGTAFSWLRMDLGGRMLFEGLVDRQSLERSPEGSLLRLECRSRAALLVDNEARPAAYNGLDCHLSISPIPLALFKRQLRCVRLPMHERILPIHV